MAELIINGNTVTGLLIDLDGVLYVGKAPVEGAVACMRRIADSGVPYRYLTNTTRMSRSTLRQVIGEMGFPGDEETIFSTPVATASYLKMKNPSAIYLIGDPSIREDFREFTFSDSSADYVVMGDPGKEINLENLNAGFRLLMKGAQLIAMQKNRFWKTEEGLVLDAGSFVAALEFSSGKQAEIIGKPSAHFFKTAVALLGIPVDHICMIGDDIEADIGGAQNVGLRTILVKTGKYRDDMLDTSNIKPDMILRSFSEICDYIKT